MPAPVPARITYGDPAAYAALAAAVGAAQRQQSYYPVAPQQNAYTEPFPTVGQPVVNQGQTATSNEQRVFRNPLKDELAAAQERHKAALAAIQNAPGTGSSFASFGAGGGATPGSDTEIGRNAVTVTRSFPNQTAASPLRNAKTDYITSRGLDPASFQNIVNNDQIDFSTAVRAVENAAPATPKAPVPGQLTDQTKAQIRELQRQIETAAKDAQAVDKTLREQRPTYSPDLGETQFTKAEQNRWDFGTGWRDTEATTDQTALALYRQRQQAIERQRQAQEQLSRLLGTGGTATTPSPQDDPLGIF